MIKHFISLTLFMTAGISSMIGAISMSVDNEPITIYEIQTLSTIQQISKKEAIDRLIQMKIEDIEIKKMGIVVSPYDIEKRLEQIAKQNGMDVETFKKALILEGQSEKSLKKDLENSLKREQLYTKIVTAKLKQPNEDEVKAYYEQHKNKFNMPSSVELVEYLSASGEALELQKRQPMVNMENIQVTPKKIELNSINPQLAQLLASTPAGSFTPVLNLGQHMGMFFIQKIGDAGLGSYEMSKKAVFETIMAEREQSTLMEYFEKKKSEAVIKTVRRVD
jgi:hypothetical protein